MICMKTKVLIKSLFYSIFWVLWFGFVNAWASQNNLNLTQNEKAWLNDHQSQEIRYAIPPKYEPISFVENGQAKGIVNEYISILSKKLNLKLKLVNVSFKEALKLARKKEIDLFPCLSQTPERKLFLAFIKDHYISFPLLPDLTNLFEHPFLV